MNKSLHRLTLCTLLTLCSSLTYAADIVDFDADDITNAVNRFSDFVFNESSATLDASSSPGYTGQSVYGGFEEEGASSWAANNLANAGLKVRWAPAAGVTGEAASGLFLFKQADFLNGLNGASVIMDAANDTVSVEAGFINPNNAVSGTSIRIVLQDDSGYHISDAQPLLSNASFSFEATTLSYSAFTPAANTATEAGTIGGASTP